MWQASFRPTHFIKAQYEQKLQQRKEEQEYRLFHDMEQGYGSLSSSTSSVSVPSSQKRMSPGYLKTKEFLDALESLPREIIGIIHDFLNPTNCVHDFSEADKKWRIALQNKFLPQCSQRFEPYKKRMVQSLSRYPHWGEDHVAWDVLVRFISQMQKDSPAEQTEMKKFSAYVGTSAWTSRIFEDVMQVDISGMKSRIAIKHLILKRFVPLLISMGLGGLCCFSAYKIFVCCVMKGPIGWRILAAWPVSSLLLAAFLCLLASCLIWDTTRDDGKNDIDRYFELVPWKKMHVDFKNFPELPQTKVRAVTDEIARLITSIPELERENLNEFLSRLTFLKNQESLTQ